jgi:carbohydrate kinase (thermoresistant glucokinase family)
MNKQCLIIFGVSGCGKSTIGQLLSDQLTLPFFDADDFHSKENIRKMNSGIPLTDADRLPWLQSINNHLVKNQNQGFILACSALKESYRKLLETQIDQITWVYLKGEFDQIYERLNNRKGHFMDPDLLQDQFDTLQIPDYGIMIPIDYSPAEIVQQIINHISE